MSADSAFLQSVIRRLTAENITLKNRSSPNIVRSTHLNVLIEMQHQLECVKLKYDFEMARLENLHLQIAKERLVSECEMLLLELDEARTQCLQRKGDLKMALLDKTKLEQDLQRADVLLNCMICMERRRDVVFSCKHLLYCEQCYMKIRYAETALHKECPICSVAFSDDDCVIFVS